MGVGHGVGRMEVSFIAKADTKCVHPEEVTLISWSRLKQKKGVCTRHSHFRTLYLIHSHQRLSTYHHSSPGTMEHWPPWLTLFLIGLSTLSKTHQVFQPCIVFLLTLHLSSYCIKCVFSSHVGQDGKAQSCKSVFPFPFPI